MLSLLHGMRSGSFPLEVAAPLMRALVESIAEELVSSALLKRMMNHAPPSAPAVLPVRLLLNQAVARRRLAHLFNSGSTTRARRCSSEARTRSGVTTPSSSKRVSSSSQRTARCLRTCF